MNELLILRALLFAAECFLASLLLPLLAFGASALLRRRAALRHLVFTTMFGVLAVLPLVTLLLPPRQIVEHVVAPLAVDTMAVTAPVIAAPPPSLLTPENIVALLVALWLAGLCWQMLRLMVGGLGLLRLRRHSVPFAVAFETGCDVRLSSGENGPSTFGIFRPIVLLPCSAEAWPSARLEAVLRHEAAHVARRDTATQFIARLVCAVFWLNPLLWLAARSLRRNAEIAADDAVLASGMTPSLYAEALVSLAAESRGIAPDIFLGIAMTTPPLAERVQSVLAENSSRKGVTKMDMAKTVTLGLTAALLLGVARFDIAVAQDVAPAAPVAPRVEKNVELEIEKNVEIEARTAAIKAKADAVTAKARAKAATETDPAKRAQYAQEAAQVAAESARVKAEADRIGDRSLSAAARIAATKVVSADALARAQDALARQQEQLQREAAGPQKQQMLQMAERAVAQARASMDQMRLAEAAPSGANVGASAESTTSTDGVTTTIRRGGPQNSDSNTNTNNGLTTLSPPHSITIAGLPPDVLTNTMILKNGASISVRVNPSAGVNRPEVRDAVRTAVDAAMAEAGKKIDIAITEARVKAGLPPVAAVPSITITPMAPHSITITPVAPVPPAPLPPPPAPG